MSDEVPSRRVEELVEETLERGGLSWEDPVNVSPATPSSSPYADRVWTCTRSSRTVTSRLTRFTGVSMTRAIRVLRLAKEALDLADRLDGARLKLLLSAESVRQALIYLAYLKGRLTGGPHADVVKILKGIEKASDVPEELRECILRVARREDVRLGEIEAHRGIAESNVRDAEKVLKVVEELS
ncbi:HEPN domain-containing protein [Methanopyrus kandleri]|uniref:Uncharacterized protein n=1 Tax=Methanopyrus kandleri TaxID=2320 RepID=A0A832T5B0_9EURY|nr:HEPN domain-containing protein [Methanopyrus kandleri]HII69759.1 hypothetical protein [Methanopyrus kandleri]